MRMAREWTFRGGGGFGSAPSLVAGIVNVTPDSFSDGGSFLAPEKALARCREIVTQGGALLDIGAESTRPGSEAISQEEEWARLRDVLAPATDMGLPVFVDTWRAATAAAALQAGAHGINDISGSTFDPGMADVLAQYKPGYVLMHTPAPPKTMQDHTHYDSVVDAVCAFFDAAMTKLTAAGLPEACIALDPGIGFGKNSTQTIELMQHIEELHKFGRPLYIGVSRKSFFGDLLGLAVYDRDAATQAVTALLACKGVYVHRVHNVAGAVAALRLASALEGPE